MKYCHLELSTEDVEAVFYVFRISPFLYMQPKQLHSSNGSIYKGFIKFCVQCALYVNLSLLLLSQI